MHRLLLAGALALALPATLPLVPARAGAQGRDSLPVLVDDVRAAARRALDIFNAPATLRVIGSLVVDSSRTIDGDVGVTGGTLVVAGHVTGRVAAINASVELHPGARVDGDIIVVGGRVTGRDEATIGGAVVAHRQSVAVRDEGGGLALDDEPLVDRWWERWRTRHARNRSALRLSSGGTYNRVEGLPVHFGPILRQRTAWGRVTAEAAGIYRSSRDFRWDSRNIGHDARAEATIDGARGSGARGVGIGGRLYDVVTPVEDWQVGDAENGFAAFFLHRDFRDHFDRHGGAGFVRAYLRDVGEVRLTLADERWGNRGLRDPWTLFRDDDLWRPNPALDEGRFRIATLSARYDTRNDPLRPWTGWFAQADIERGSGDATRLGPSTSGDVVLGETDWVRGFLDVRRYNRLAPTTQLNLRLVAGGWLGGDPLPLNRRLSVGGIGSLPGLDFRRDAPASTTCTRVPDDLAALPAGRPAECERIVLAQVEYRSDIPFNFDLGEGMRVRRVAQLAVFANSGRGWLVGPRVGELQYRGGHLPSLSTFRTDIGGGLDFGPIGFFVAKSVTDGDEKPNFFVRIGRRF